MESNHPSRICNPGNTKKIKDLAQHRESPPRRRRHIVIAGLLPSIGNILVDEYRDTLDIRLYGSSEGITTLAPMCKKADAVIGMIDFLSHKHHDAMVASPAPYIAISGGVTKLRTELTRQAAL